MAGNRLSVLPPEIGLLSALKRLGLKGNALVRLPGSLGDLSQLSELYLTRNNLEELPDEVRRRVLSDARLMGGREGRWIDIFAETSIVETLGLLTARVGHVVGWYHFPVIAFQKTYDLTLAIKGSSFGYVFAQHLPYSFPGHGSRFEFLCDTSTATVRYTPSGRAGGWDKLPRQEI